MRLLLLIVRIALAHAATPAAKPYTRGTTGQSQNVKLVIGSTDSSTVKYETDADSSKTPGSYTGDTPNTLIGRVFVYRESAKKWGTICKSNSYSTAAVACRAVTPPGCGLCVNDVNTGGCPWCPISTDALNTNEALKYNPGGDCHLVPKKMGYAKFWEAKLPPETPYPDAPIWGSNIVCPDTCNLFNIDFAMDSGTALTSWASVPQGCASWQSTQTDARNWNRDEANYAMCSHEEDLFVVCGQKVTPPPPPPPPLAPEISPSPSVHGLTIIFAEATRYFFGRVMGW